MGKSIPVSLGFVRSSLHDGEAERWLGWYNNLANPDKMNVGRFLRNSYVWMSDEAERLRRVREKWQKEIKESGREPDKEFLKGDYFIVGAIGSTLGGQDYKDVDLLVVTNRIWRDMGSFQEALLEQKLSGNFEYTIDPIVSQAYDQIWGRPDRTLVTLNPRQGKGKTIHVTVQPEIIREKYWRENDEEPSTVLYRFGDTTGHYDFMEDLGKGAQLMEKFLKIAESSFPIFTVKSKNLTK